MTAVGSAVSASGAANSAKAIGDANASNAEREQALYDRQQKALNSLSADKMNKLSNLGNIFDRMQSTGAFGDTNTLKNLRKAQSDYSALAAGDFSGFEAQLRQSLSDSLIATAGSGAPIGTFAGLAAQDQMNLRGQGIQTTMGISDYLSNETYKLLGNEFGIMDQKFEVGYKLDRDKVSGMNQYNLGQAATQGVAQTAYGNAGQQIGSSVISAYNNYQNRQTIQQSNANQLEIAQMAYGNNRAINPATGQRFPYASGYSNYNNLPIQVPTGAAANPMNGAVAGDFPVVLDLPSGVSDTGPGVLPPLNDWQYSIPNYNTRAFETTEPQYYQPQNSPGYRQSPSIPGYYQPQSGFSILSQIGASISGY